MDAWGGTSRVDRRQFVALTAAGGLAAALPGVGRAAASVQRYAIPAGRWVVTTEAQPWQIGDQPARIAPGSGSPADMVLQLDRPLQTMEGFGACFNEMGWDAINLLPPAEQDKIFAELFGDAATGLSLCRMPIGANDFARDWYSYDETPGDFALRSFSIARDDSALVPFIKRALAVRPDLRIWASPWSPPSWMKTNRHYAAVPNRPGWPDNGLLPSQVGTEGTDMFEQDERYFDAYARYFGRFIDEYARRGIRIAMVMPQNEFNSAQPFPSCCWTPKGLARFLPHLGREMARRDVEVFFGTMERPDDRLFEAVYADTAAASVIRGVGVQWAGRGALPFLARAHPTLRFYMSEQECGDGKNDWRYARYTWSLMKQYLSNGCSGYDYWNIALVDGGVSRWGWAQNSLLSVDRATRSWRWNHEFYLLKHLAGIVRSGAVRIPAISWTGYEDVLAFRNQDGSIAVMTHNPTGAPMHARIGIGAATLEAVLPADSFGSILLPPR
ncbi:glycoside hydrolase family 30 protein [Sphingomonas azotifigens]|uniref:glycoside hydrolase family 30 protein n=1 Tax=Sphingomonas azotifigens TaxID=330920 RepID=UPI000A04575F|nr:glycoside hydrolase family 30 beta sandwich domain-containing protein [Sphingomonas azotifigens]